MGEEIAYENVRISNFQGLVTSTLDRVMLHNLHTVMHDLSTSTYIPYFIQIKKKFFWESQLSLLPTSKSCDTKLGQK